MIPTSGLVARFITFDTLNFRIHVSVKFFGVVKSIGEKRRKGAELLFLGVLCAFVAKIFAKIQTF